MSLTSVNIKVGNVVWLVLLRIVVGWHFLYEGLFKVLDSDWSSAGYLLDSKGFMSWFFIALVSNQIILSIVDLLNQWGLVFIGLGLILGILTRCASFAGMVLLLFYYLSHPPFLGLNYTLPAEGNYFVIDKVFIEICALGVLSQFPTGRSFGLGSLFKSRYVKS